MPIVSLSLSKLSRKLTRVFFDFSENWIKTQNSCQGFAVKIFGFESFGTTGRGKNENLVNIFFLKVVSPVILSY